VPATNDSPLNRQQRTVVDHVLAGGLTVVGAGAGSGKTHTMVAALMALLDTGHSADQFVLITFTNKAADELRSRVESEVRSRVDGAAGDDRARWLDQQERLSAAYMGTIHGFALRLLRTYGYESRVPRTARMSMSNQLLAGTLRDALEDTLAREDDDATALLDLAVDEHVIRRVVRRIFAAARAQARSLEELASLTAAQADDDGRRYRVAVADLVSDTDIRYAAEKQAQGLLDSDDLLIKTAELLSDVAVNLPQRLASRIRFVFVDEFQDTDRTQKQIIDCLIPHLDAVLVVGDRKQSIYRFRSAEPSLLDELARDQGVDVLPLNMSRRPTQVLLDAQNALFQGMSDRYPELAEPLEAFDGTLPGTEGLPPIVVAPASSSDQATAISRLIRRVVGMDVTGEAGPRALAAGDLVILTRSNRVMHELTAELRGLLAGDGIEVRPDRGAGFYERPEVVATYRMLRLLLSWPDDAALSMALRTPYLTEAGDASAREREVLQYGIREGRPLTDWFEQHEPALATMLADLRQAARIDTAPQLLGRMFEAFDLRSRLEAAGDLTGLEAVELLREQARALFANEQALTLRSFTEWLGTAILAGFDLDDSGPPTEGLIPAYVRVMTIHRAKGLQFPIVIVPRMARPLNNPELQPEFLLDHEGLDLRLEGSSQHTASSAWPGKMAAEATDRREEEMRLFYVAVTRAQHCVMLVGGTDGQPNPPDDQFYAWRDEVYRAQTELERNGARFLRRGW
jgi:DNA helicase-2/ATP-dependent DNA helicase PcrA